MRNKIILLAIIPLAIIIFISSCGEENIKYQRYYSDGSQLYKIHCQNCHMSNGEGLGQLIPPLTDSIFLRKNREKLVCYVNYGLNDSIKINGIDYQGQMPAEKHLAAIDLAKTLTFITNSFGNNQGIYDVIEVQKNLNNCK
ncbi:MAG: cytochrome c [Bacteroidetes bacterium]|nr:cytochrome c [Bacteroidota bacterium]MBU1372494.1 cytochrome c [Bacteroidota bacterium]MBU1485097.1 cytochrome c [Bacteroidota bacterium]MBU1762036.1 cytochrome c [Bacteroidota bacterium]MBU2267931.1 cytochrome c [Bacteroidota bacterium]